MMPNCNAQRERQWLGSFSLVWNGVLSRPERLSAVKWNTLTKYGPHKLEDLVMQGFDTLGTVKEQHCPLLSAVLTLFGGIEMPDAKVSLGLVYIRQQTWKGHANYIHSSWDMLQAFSKTIKAIESPTLTPNTLITKVDFLQSTISRYCSKLAPDQLEMINDSSKLVKKSICTVPHHLPPVCCNGTETNEYNYERSFDIT